MPAPRSLSPSHIPAARPFTTPGGFETPPSAPFQVTSGAAGKVTLSGLAAGPDGCQYLTIYRTAAGGSTYTRAATLSGIGADLPSTYLDTASDASIAGGASL